VAHIELPVCIIFFPDLHDGAPDFKEKGIDLITVCREIFIVVNRQAKQVSKSRELLLDDEDFAALMMRRTLTCFKDRDGDSLEAARIYSFAFGESRRNRNLQESFEGKPRAAGISSTDTTTFNSFRRGI
jgi:hypothetical protein